MRLAIADPPYLGRAARWYGDKAHTLGPHAHAADNHPDAAEWDNPARHRQLIEELEASYDGYAIACPPSGIDAYRPLPVSARIMIWVKPNAMPSSGRIHNKWEAVIARIPDGRWTARGGIGVTPDVLIAPKQNDGFAGKKPDQWTRWVLDALSYNEDTDTVDDLFPGSGSVSAVLSQPTLLGGAS